MRKQIIFLCCFAVLITISIILLTNAASFLLVFNGNTNIPDSFWTQTRAIIVLTVSSLVGITSFIMMVILIFKITKKINR